MRCARYTKHLQKYNIYYTIGSLQGQHHNISNYFSNGLHLPPVTIFLQGLDSLRNFLSTPNTYVENKYFLPGNNNPYPCHKQCLSEQNKLISEHLTDIFTCLNSILQWIRIQNNQKIIRTLVIFNQFIRLISTICDNCK